MVAALTRDFQLGQWHAGIMGILIAVVIAVVSFILHDQIGEPIAGWLAVAGVLGVIGVAVLVMRRRQLQTYDPNAADISERMKLAARYAKTVEEFRDYLRHYGIEWNLPPDLEAKYAISEMDDLRFPFLPDVQ